jgi:hypothetical protein
MESAKNTPENLKLHMRNKKNTSFRVLANHGVKSKTLEAKPRFLS